MDWDWSLADSTLSVIRSVPTQSVGTRELQIVMTSSRYRVVDDRSPHFFTCSVVGWLPVFTRPAAVQIVLDSWRFLQENNRMQLFGYVVMENHAHLIASARDPTKEIGDFKSFTARTIIDRLQSVGDETLLNQLHWQKAAHKLDRTYQLWQEGSHPQLIQNDDMMRQKLEYIHNNPVRRGYVDDPLHWRYSSARNYAGLPSVLRVTTEW
jgi:REP element-mobilizing transposase RayT